MSSLAEELSRLTNTAPTWADPEDISDGAQLLKQNKNEEKDETLEAPSNLRKRAANFLDDDDDQRYHGRKISRKALKKDDDIPEEDLDDFESSPDEEAYESEDSVDEDRLQENYLGKSGKQENGEEESSEEESDDEDEEDMSDGEEHTSYVDFNNSQGQMDSEESDEEETSIKKLTSTPEELQKGQAVRNQLALWETLLKTRIELQKVTSKGNLLPQPDALQGFTGLGGQEYTEAMQQAKSGLYKVLAQLVHLQTFLLAQNKNTASLTSSKSGGAAQKSKTDAEDGDDEEIPSDSEGEEEKMPEHVPLKQLKRSQYPGFITQRHNVFAKFRDDTVQKWYDKTRVSSGKLGKGFSAFDQSALKQIQQILSDKDRLLKRTQLKRTSYRVLGKRIEKVTQQEDNDEEEEEALPKRDHLKEYDEEIFDDDDFYHQMLRELIESKSRDINDPIAITKHWLEIQKLRKKAKKVVDTRASKGRKIRYEVHPKMVNFMASSEISSWTDEAKNELYSSLFGGKQTQI